MKPVMHLILEVKEGARIIDREFEFLVVSEDGAEMFASLPKDTPSLSIRATIEAEKIADSPWGTPPAQLQLLETKKCADCKGSGGTGGQDGDDPFITCPTCEGKGYA